MALAGVYPPGMKILAGWFWAGRGFAIGVLVGSLTVGTALPRLVRAVGPVLGPLSMLRLCGLPAAARLAGGRG